MLSIFHSGPGTSDQIDPTFVGTFGLILTGKVEAGFECGVAGWFLEAAVLNADQGASEWEIAGPGGDVAPDQAPFIDSAVTVWPSKVGLELSSAGAAVGSQRGVPSF